MILDNKEPTMYNRAISSNHKYLERRTFIFHISYVFGILIHMCFSTCNSLKGVGFCYR